MTIFKVLSTVWILFVLVTNVESQECDDAFTAYIVLDGSKSIGSDNFVLVKNAVKNFTAQAIVRNSANRIGIVVFSDDVTNNIKASSSISALANEIDNILYPESGTATDMGISFASGELQKDESFNRRVMIVITDGNSNDLNKTLEAARKAKEDGITIIAVGIDEIIKMLVPLYESFEKELLNIASYNSLIYRTGFFGDLATPLNEALQHLCQHTVSIVSPLEDLTVISETRAILRVMLTDPDVTNVVWRRYGKELDNNTLGYTQHIEGREHSLIRFNTRLEHSGEYSFAVGNATSRCTLTVIARLRNISVKTGEDAYFQIFVSPEPIAGGKWLKNDQLILFSPSKYAITQQASLRSLSVLNVQDSDEGIYTFTLNNVSTWANLTAQGPPVPGGWSAWNINSSTPCPDCGLDAWKNVTRIRTCTNPAPADGGRDCEGSALRIDRENCSLRVECPVNGSWSEWTAWRSNCDNETCGQTYDVDAVRTRACNNPPPSGAGLYCRGESYQTITTMCQRVPCRGPPVPGGWSPWNNISSTPCPDCGLNATKNVTRVRTCTNPAPAEGGRDCEGSALRIDRENCNLLEECPGPPVPGGWSPWNNISSTPCPDCGLNATKNVTRVRTCTNPAPAEGGRDCEGSALRIDRENCNLLEECPGPPVPGGWSPWNNISSTPCPDCGLNATKNVTRVRTCTNPAPAEGGRDCEGSALRIDRENCNLLEECPGPPVPGGWSPWNNISSTPCPDCGLNATKNVTRVRTCTNPAPAEGGGDCEGSALRIDRENCNLLEECPGPPVPGGWSPWNNISSTPCPDCGLNATKNVTRVRTCTNPAPAEGGRDCEGSALRIDRENCNLLEECPGPPVPGGWSPWNNISSTPCPDCGLNATKNVTRVRTCTNPAPAEGGRDCEGSALRIDRENCNLLEECPGPPVPGGWSPWNNISSTPCPDCGLNATKNVTRVRTCTNPAPAEGGRDCEGSALRIDRENCNLLEECPGPPVPGGWSAWNNISSTPCPDCGLNATKNVIWLRTCTNPAPAEGGRDCEGSALRIDRENCNLLEECPGPPVPGGWSPWNNISSTPCPDCGLNATKNVTRVRTCTNPAPAEGGRDCEGSALRIDRENCNLLEECPGPPVPGGWSPWNNISSTPCPDCGLNATKNVTRVRTCTNPAPAEGGRDCEGSALRIDRENCNLLEECPGPPVPGGWSPWNNISSTPCPDCGLNATKNVTRVRTCTNPAPAEGGRDCEGSALRIDRENCNLLEECPGPPVPGGWSPWNNISSTPCPDCGLNATKNVTRVRTCTNPAPAEGGRDCEGSALRIDRENCNLLEECPGPPVPGGWSPWNNISSTPCPDCGLNATKNVTRVRTCTNPAPAEGGRDCEGSALRIDRENCNLLEECPGPPVPGGWSAWNNISSTPCPDCGLNATKNVIWLRTCTNPAPAEGGRDCEGSALRIDRENCNLLEECPGPPVPGGWSPWNNISSTPCPDCGLNATKNVTRVRTCTNPAPAEGGRDCEGSALRIDRENCNLLEECPGPPVPGGWSAWNNISSTPCPDCGLNATKNVIWLRTCTNPAPAEGGRDCEGSALRIDRENCNLLEECPGPPVPGGWSPWNNISSTPCPDCGLNATKNVIWLRTCTNPAPAEGGRDCEGSALRIDRENCNLLEECPGPPVPGGWSPWNNISSTPCPDCGLNATKNVIWLRTCTNPAPAEGGRDCEGSALRIDRENCNLLEECPGPPVPGGWSPWNISSSTPCPDCGLNATMNVTRIRTCTNPAPANGGQNCEGSALRTDKENCNLLVECPVDGHFGLWSPWTSSACSVTCGGGKRPLSRQRRCDSPEPSNGGENCTGNFEESKLEDCNQFPCNGLCDDVIEKDDVGYRYHQSDCDKYIQCYSNVDGNVLAVVRTCPAGFYWNQAKFKCQESRRVLCPLESYSSSRMSMKKIPGSCRSYWLKEERAQARCCPLSFSFVEGKGCRPNNDCQDLCPQPFEHRYVCDKRPLSLTRSPSYQLYNSARGWVNTTCPTGTFFNLGDCGCSELARDTCVSGFSAMFNTSPIPDWMSSTGVTFRDGAANFFGFGMINFDINLGAKFNPIKIEFRYNETEAILGSRILLRSNCDDHDDDLSVRVDNDTVNVHVKSGNKDVQQLDISTLGIKRSDWKTVTLVYDGHRFVITIESGNVRYSGDLYVYGSDFAQCQMIFGSETASSSTNAFSGSLSMISFSRCNLGLTA